MKKWKIAALIFTLSLTGCGGLENYIKETSISSESGQEESVVNKGENESSVSDLEKESSEEGENNSEEGGDDSEERELTESELKYFGEYLSRMDNYGFLLSAYDSPEYADLAQVFYNGAGLEPNPLTKEEEEEFLRISGGSEIVTDVTRLTTSQIDEFLERKIGLHLMDMKNPLSWIYLPVSDSYAAQHGDTNWMQFICIEGRKTQDIYVIRAKFDWEAKYNYICEITLQKEGEEYRFLSNHIILDDLGITAKPASSEAEVLREAVSDYLRAQGKNDSDLDTGIFESADREYTEKELSQIPSELYPVFRNEIYARHGYIFKNELWNEFFSAYSWYDGNVAADDFNNALFNKVEAANLKLVKQIEDKNSN